MLEEKYLKVNKEIENNIKLLKERIKSHNKSFKNNKTNWGYLGDLESLNKDLEEMLGFLK